MAAVAVAPDPQLGCCAALFLEKARQSMEAGATGLIFGRNVWQRDHDESLRFVARLREILAKYPSGAGRG